MTTTWRPNGDEDELRGVFTVRRTPPPVELTPEPEPQNESRNESRDRPDPRSGPGPGPDPQPQSEPRSEPQFAFESERVPDRAPEPTVEPTVDPADEDTAELVPEGATRRDGPAPDDGGRDDGRDGGSEGGRCPEPVLFGKGDPVHGGPAHGGPVHGEPVHGGPVHGEPVHGGPVHGEPVHGGPVHGDPARIGPAPAGPVGDDPHADRPVLAAFGAPAPGAGAAPFVRTAGVPRWSPLIVGESTQEIPVHLLFRDEADALETAGHPAGHPAGRPVGQPVRPTVVGRRWGTGEQPRVRRVPGPAPMPAAPTRAAPPVDPKLTERPGPVLPGWAAALVGCVTLVGCAAVVWSTGAVPDGVSRVLGLPWRAYHGIGLGQWALLVLGVTVTLFAFGGLGRGRVGQAWVLTLFGDYRGSVRRTGLLWVSPLLLRRGVDVRLRHWRSEPVPAVDSNGTALRVVVLVVWRVRDTVRAALGVKDHEEYLREQVEAAMARVLSQLPADAFHDEAPTLRDAEAVGDALTRMLSAECRPVGVEVFSAQPTRIEYAPEIATAMQRSRIAAIDARHRDTVLTSVVDAVDDTVNRLTSRGLVELDDYERKALVKDLTVAFYTGRQGAAEKW
ncbi:SPFH domain-containing protein [Streptomyces sp. NPDC088551]|uniref:SPFH domain-containing protein n=1 Tax=Streptomyces sp. NPDC088551 TaxID=3365863 RepID=UPI003822DA0B